ncbi:MAG: ATP-binding protein [Bacteroidota bacterium]
MLCGLGAVMVPAYLLLTNGLGLDHRDSMGVRVGISGLLLICLGLTYTPRLSERRLIGLMLGVVYLLVTWMATVVYFNPGDTSLLLGFLYVYFITSSVYQIAGLRASALVTFHAYALAAAAVAVLHPETHHAVAVFFLTCLLGMGGIATLTWHAVIHIRRGLVGREGELERAQRLARLGSWSYDPDSERLHFSTGLHSLLGLDVGVIPRPALAATLVHPDDLEACLAYAAHLTRGHAPDDLTLRARTPLGERWLRLHSHAEADARGRPTVLSGIVMDVTAQHERERALREAHRQAEAGRVRAEEASRLKSTILTNVSHEIRTPLNAILGFADVLAEEVPANLQAFVAPVQDNGHRLLDTLNALLDLAQLRAGEVVLRTETFDLAASVQAALAALQDRHASREVTLTFEADPIVLRGQSDRKALVTVVNHLVRNALAFTATGSVGVRLVREERWAVLTVTDTGQGIGAAFLPHLFEAFRQEDDGLARRHEGSGLGLAVTKAYVDLLGGTMLVQSEVGTGTAVEVRLPLTVPLRGDGVAHTGQVPGLDAVRVRVGEESYS